MQFASATTINAPVEQVWPVLADLEHWPAWDSAVARTAGRLARGERVTLWPEANPNRGFRLRVTRFDPPTDLTLEGGMPMGLFRGVRTYRLSPDPAGGTHFEMREVYSGPLLGLIGRSIPDLQPSFETFAAGLKQRVEKVDRTHP
jgi:hypothetical protein